MNIDWASGESDSSEPTQKTGSKCYFLGLYEHHLKDSSVAKKRLLQSDTNFLNVIPSDR
jgi:hypothetical protein